MKEKHKSPAFWEFRYQFYKTILMLKLCVVKNKLKIVTKVNVKIRVVLDMV
jgi:hypothetical protein